MRDEKVVSNVCKVKVTNILPHPQGMWGRREEVSGFKVGLCKVSNLNKIEKISALWTDFCFCSPLGKIRDQI